MEIDQLYLAPIGCIIPSEVLSVKLETRQAFCFSSLYQKQTCTALIVAAGHSTRMGGVDKLFATLGDKPVLAHTLLAYQNCAVIDGIVVAAREDAIPDVQKLSDAYGITKLRAIVAGGATRDESVRAAVEAAGTDCRYFAIADGARPLTTAEEIENTLEGAMRWGAAISAVPVTDTIKTVDGQRRITGTPDRSTLWAAQTPQVFPAEAYRQSLSDPDGSYTDDSARMEKMGVSVAVVEGRYDNIKITTPTDLVMAEAIWKERRQ